MNSLPTEAIECVFFCIHHSQQYHDAVCMNQLVDKYTIDDISRIITHQGFDLRHIEVGNELMKITASFYTIFHLLNTSLIIIPSERILCQKKYGDII